MVTEYHLSCLSLLQKYPYLLVGYSPRSYKEISGEYKYSKGKFNTIMLTNVAFIHHKYLELFTHTVPKIIMDYIVETKNGEDLTMNVVIGKYLTELGHPMCIAVYVKSDGKKDFGNLSSELAI